MTENSGSGMPFLGNREMMLFKIIQILVARMWDVEKEIPIEGLIEVVSSIKSVFRKRGYHFDLEPDAVKKAVDEMVRFRYLKYPKPGYITVTLEGLFNCNQTFVPAEIQVAIDELLDTKFVSKHLL